MERDFLDKLKGVYKVKINRDIFGRRDALPTEIKSVIQPEFPESLDQYLPTEQDVYLKEQVLNRRRQSRKPR